MAEVGKWTPWDPSPNDVKDQEFANEQLNTLMKKYKENEDSREKFFEERTKGPKSVATAAATAATTITESFGGMFSGQGDLAHQRKVEKATVTMEKVSDEKEDP